IGMTSWNHRPGKVTFSIGTRQSGRHSELHVLILHYLRRSHQPHIASREYWFWIAHAERLHKTQRLIQLWRYAVERKVRLHFQNRFKIAHTQMIPGIKVQMPA